VSTSARGGEHAAATVIASELGDLIAKVAADTFAAGHAIAGARTTKPSASIRIPAAAKAAWKRRLHHIDQAHARIAAVHGADPVRTAALHTLETLRSSCRAGELALTSSTPAERSHYAKRQQADEGRLHSATESLTAKLSHAGVAHL
jgi:hypothetical protein